MNTKGLLLDTTQKQPRGVECDIALHIEGVRETLKLSKVWAYTEWKQDGSLSIMLSGSFKNPKLNRKKDEMPERIIITTNKLEAKVT